MSQAANVPDIYSTLAVDPDFGELVEMFVAEMPDRIDALATQARNRDWQQLARTAHQFKGAVGSYGFSAITPSAARLEHAARDGSQEELILASLHDLVEMCRRARPGKSPAENASCS